MPFRVAIPGHGEPMNPAQFGLYTGAFNAFMDCVQGKDEAGACATAWADAIEPLLDGAEGGRETALEYAEYYVGMLRENGGKSAECRTP